MTVSILYEVSVHYVAGAMLRWFFGGESAFSCSMSMNRGPRGLEVVEPHHCMEEIKVAPEVLQLRVMRPRMERS